MKLNADKLLPNRKKKQWVVLANRTGAQIYKLLPGADAKLVKSLDFPEGKLRNRDLSPDRPVRSFARSKGSTSRSASEKGTKGHEIVGDVFARKIAEAMDKGRVSEAYDELILVAEPKFLGVIRKALPEAVEDKIAKVVRKDLAKLSEAKIKAWLKEF